MASDAIMLTPGQEALRFGRFTLDPRTASLVSEGRRLALRPKSFDLLVHLARNSGRLVAKDELMEAIWPNVFVTDNSLVQCISEIRAALDDESQAILKTVARRGYLFAAPVEIEPEPPDPTAEEASPRGRTFLSVLTAPGRAARAGELSTYKIAIGAVVVLLPVVGAAFWLLFGPDTDAARSRVSTGASPVEAVSGRPSIAVLPFDDFGADPTPQGLGEGLADHLISALSSTPKMLVIARHSTFAYKGKPVNIQQISQELGARFVLAGSVSRAGPKLRIATQLADASTGYQMWAETYDRDLGDIFALQDEIVLDVVAALQIELTQGELARIRQKGTNNLRAWLLVNQSFDHLLRFTREDNETARRLAEEALTLDPDYAEAYVRLGRTHLVDFHAGWSADRDASLRKSIDAAQKALSLDENYPDTYHLLSAIYLYLKRHDDAQLAIARALELSPNHSLAKANLGMILTYAGEPEAAIAEFKEAMRLSPIFPSWYLSELARAYFQAGRYDDAIAALERRLQDEPDSGEALILLAAAASANGRLEKARSALVRFLAPRPDFTQSHYASGEFYRDPADLQRVLAALESAGLPE
jgi:adenylate cyclase